MDRRGERRHRQRGARLERRLEQRRYDPVLQCCQSRYIYDEWQQHRRENRFTTLECVCVCVCALLPHPAVDSAERRIKREEYER